MKILFIGEGLADYTVSILNKLQAEPGVELFNLVPSNGLGHVPAGVRQTREGVKFTIVELESVVSNKYSDHNYWNFKGLEEKLKDIKPDIVSFSFKYARMFLYDTKLKKTIQELRCKLILNDNPYRTNARQKKIKDIEDGKKDQEYTPYYLLYVLSALEQMGLRHSQIIRKEALQLLSLLGLYSTTYARRILLKRVEEIQNILLLVNATVSYNEIAYEVYPTYGMPKEKIFVKYNSPDTDILFDIRKRIEKEDPILPSNPHRLIHLGRLAPYKKTELLIEALSLVKKEFKDTELLIIGQGPEETKLRSVAQQYKVEDSVFFSGWVDQSKMGKYLLASSIYVLAGNGGLAINDAMAFGRPVICSVADGTEKHLVFEGYNGSYFKSGDVEDLATKIMYLFTNPELLQSMGEHSTDIIKNKINIHTTINAYVRAFDYALTKSN